MILTGNRFNDVLSSSSKPHVIVAQFDLHKKVCKYNNCIHTHIITHTHNIYIYIQIYVPIILWICLEIRYPYIQYSILVDHHFPNQLIIELGYTVYIGIPHCAFRTLQRTPNTHGKWMFMVLVVMICYDLTPH